MFDESDGTEIDDNESLLAYEKGSIFILGSQWKPATEEIEAKVERRFDWRSKQGI